MSKSINGCHYTRTGYGVVSIPSGTVLFHGYKSSLEYIIQCNKGIFGKNNLPYPDAFMCPIHIPLRETKLPFVFTMYMYVVLLVSYIPEWCTECSDY